METVKSKTHPHIEVPATWEGWDTLFQKAIEEKGADYVYEAPEGTSTCAYLAHKEEEDESGEVVHVEYLDTPGCIVGNALMRCGATRNDLLPINTEQASTALKELGLPLPSPVKEAINSTQGRQDGGATWQDALEYGREQYAQYQEDEL